MSIDRSNQERKERTAGATKAAADPWLMAPSLSWPVVASCGLRKVKRNFIVELEGQMRRNLICNKRFDSENQVSVFLSVILYVFCCCGD